MTFSLLQSIEICKIICFSFSASHYASYHAFLNIFLYRLGSSIFAKKTEMLNADGGRSRGTIKSIVLSNLLEITKRSWQ